MISLTPKQLQLAYEHLKAKGVEFPYTLELITTEGSTKILFQADGTYSEAKEEASQEEGQN